MKARLPQHVSLKQPFALVFPVQNLIQAIAGAEGIWYAFGFTFF